MDSHKSYDTFHDKGKDSKIPYGYKKIRVNLEFDVIGKYVARMMEGYKK